MLIEYHNAERVAKRLHYDRNDYNEVAPDQLSDLDLEEREKLSVGKSLYHQETTNIIEMNTKYVSNDGYSEVVYDSQGNLVTHELDVGTYNFFSPIDDDKKHYLYDVKPYYEWGNGNKYNSNLIDRLLPF